jgi:aryl-alcohol dehydrogenase-like predicted oxidoreductase
LRALVPPNLTLAQFALRWIGMHDAVSCSIPGAKRAEQVAENAAAADLPPLSEDAMQRVRDIYDARVRPLVHHYW